MGAEQIGGIENAGAVPVDLFQSDLRQVCGLFDVDPSCRSGTVTGSAAIRRLGRFDAADVRLDARSVSRGARLISDDPGEHFFAILQLEGRCLIQQSDRANLLAPGEICIVDSSQPSEFLYNGIRSRQVSFHLPRDEMVGRFGTVFDGWSHIPDAKTWFPAIREVAGKLLDSGSVQTSRQLEESFLSLLGAALWDIAGREVAPERQATAIIEEAIRIIERNCTDPCFTPANLADALGIAPRTLQRHFSKLGETAGRRLLDARLAEAHRQLATSGPDRDRSVTEIAFASGFSDLSHFHREFRARYGTTPGELKTAG